MPHSRFRRSAIPAVLACLALAGCGDSPSSSEPGAPARLELSSGDLQHAVVGKALSQPLVVKVTDDKGKPVPRFVVNFKVVAGNGSVYAGAAQTDDNGTAQEIWTLGTVARDTQRVEVRVVDGTTGAPQLLGVFRAVGDPDVPSKLVKVSADPQAAPAGSPVPVAPAVKVTDRYDNPIAGQSVSFAVAEGGGVASPATGVTDAAGIVSVQWTLGNTVGTRNRLSASGAGAAVEFQAQAGLPANLVVRIVAGSGQSAAPGALMPQPIVAQVVLPDNRPVAGVLVRWEQQDQAGQIAGAVGPTSGVTDAEGKTATNWRMGLRGNPQRLDARLDASPAIRATATATLIPGAVSTLQDTRVGLPVPKEFGRAGGVDTLGVRAYDVYGNPLAGQQVTWTVEDGYPASILQFTASTDATGLAQVMVQLPTILHYRDYRTGLDYYLGDNYRVTAHAGAAATTLQDVVTPAAPARIANAPDTLRWITQRFNVSTRLYIQSADQYGNVWTLNRPGGPRGTVVGDGNVVHVSAGTFGKQDLSFGALGTAKIVWTEGAAVDTTVVVVLPEGTAPFRASRTAPAPTRQPAAPRAGAAPATPRRTPAPARRPAGSRGTTAAPKPVTRGTSTGRQPGA
jgi:hypothetical protein